MLPCPGGPQNVAHIQGFSNFGGVCVCVCWGGPSITPRPLINKRASFGGPREEPYTAFFNQQPGGSDAGAPTATLWGICAFNKFPKEHLTSALWTEGGGRGGRSPDREPGGGASGRAPGRPAPVRPTRRCLVPEPLTRPRDRSSLQQFPQSTPPPHRELCKKAGVELGL